MPSRILREGIIDSESFGSLTEGAQLLYYRLLSMVDDFGRYEANPRLLIIRLFPWAQDRYDAHMMASRLGELSEGLDPRIKLYSVGNKQYLEIIDSQRTPRARKSRYPDPLESVGVHRTPLESVVKQQTSSNTNTNTNTNTGEESARETADEFEFVDWCEAVWARHPKKTYKRLAFVSLASRFAEDIPARSVFDKNHRLHCETPEWRKAGGSFAPPLCAPDDHGFVPDEGWKYPPMRDGPAEDDADKHERLMAERRNREKTAASY